MTKNFLHRSIGIAALSVLLIFVLDELITREEGKRSDEVKQGNTASHSEKIEFLEIGSNSSDLQLYKEESSQASQTIWSADKNSIDSTFTELEKARNSIELPFERRLMNGKQLPEGDMEDAMIASALSSNHPVKDYEKESYFGASPEARSLTQVYTLAVEEAILDNGKPLQLDGLACGIRICMGVISGGNEEDYIKWSSVFTQRPEAIGLGLTTVVAPGIATELNLRIAFTVKPFLYMR